MFTKIKAFLIGKKTYLVAVAAVLTATAAWAGGDIDLMQYIEALFAAAGLTTIRASIK